jgi:plastocyanin
MLAAAAMGTAASFLLVGCSGSSPSEAHPSVNFGASASITPGMAGGGPSGATVGPTTADRSQTQSASAAAQTGNAVSVENFAFAPATLTVPVGSTVSWTNHDADPHTVAANDGSFHSPGMGTGATFSFTFPTAGTFDYVCSIHPFMHGTVVVTK